MGILTTNQIITGIKPKEKPTNRGFEFDKKQPIHAHNFPLTKFTIWRIYGWKWDQYHIKRIPYWLTKKLPTGKDLNPKMVGLDGFYDVKSTFQTN